MDMCACLHPLTCYFCVCVCMCVCLGVQACVCVHIYCAVLYGRPDTDCHWANDALAMAKDGLVWNK